MLTSRPWRDDADLRRMLDIVARTIRRDGIEGGNLHAGDVIWGLFMHEGIDPATTVRLVEDGDGVITGFLWFYGDGVFVVVTDPDHPGRARLARESIDLAERHIGAAGEPPESFCIELLPGEALMAEVAAGAGYAASGDAMLQLNHRRLDGPIETSPLPPGAVVRLVDVANPDEVAARVALHREVWAPSKLAHADYARLRDRPIYRPDLDLVAVTPEGDLAAYAIVWWDPVTRVGEFEPVGASVRHRRRGYASAVMIEGLRRLRALGATDAVVNAATRAESEPSRRLYASLGFDVVGPYEAWRKPAPTSSRA